MKQNSKQINYVAPFITMVFLFFIVGFLTSTNGQFQAPLKGAFLSKVGDLKNTFVTLITLSWFLAYPCTGKVGSNWVTKYGYKGTLIRGLIVMIAGLGILSLSSWFTVNFPESNVYISTAIVPFGFFIFLVGSFVLGSSATILQVVINPYLTACTVKGTQSIQRLSIGGASNSIGTTIAPFFVTSIVFSGLSMEQVQVKQIMLPFLALAAVLLLIIIILSRISLPDIEGTKAEAGEKLPRSVWSFRHFKLGVIAIFFYVGVEVCIGNNLVLYALDKYKSDISIPALMATLYWGGMLVGRLVASSLSKVPPRTQLTVTTLMASLLVCLSIVTSNPWLLVAVGLFHSIMWGAIFTLAVAQLGKYTSIASGVFMIGVAGGAVLPFVQGSLADAFQGEWRFTWFLVLIGELYMLFYARSGSRIKEQLSGEII